MTYNYLCTHSIRGISAYALGTLVRNSRIINREIVNLLSTRFNTPIFN